MIMTSLIEQLERHEGFRDKPYLDTVGKLSIGYGRNLDDVPLRRDEAELMLLNDILKAQADCRSSFPGFAALSSVRQNVIVNMTFNMGPGGVARFRKMIESLRVQDYAGAAREMLDSKWARQVGVRADELAEQMRENREVRP